MVVRVVDDKDVAHLLSVNVTGGSPLYKITIERAEAILSSSFVHGYRLSTTPKLVCA